MLALTRRRLNPESFRSPRRAISRRRGGSRLKHGRAGRNGCIQNDSNESDCDELGTEDNDIEHVLHEEEG